MDRTNISLSSAVVLTPDELEALTGCKRCDAQAAALNFMGIEHKARPDGSIAVLKSHVEQVLGGGVVKTAKEEQPNTDVFKKRA